MFHELQSFLSGYLHQDFDIEFPEPLDAARQFATESELTHVYVVIGQIAVLTADEDESKVEAFTKNAGLGYWPGDGQTLSWLREAASAMALAASERSE